VKHDGDTPGALPVTRLVVATFSVAVSACGRIGFGAAGEPDEPGFEVLIDFSDAYTFIEQDFVDGNIQSNELEAICTLPRSFDSPLVVIAGRTLIELDPGRPPVVHDYRPAMNDTTGPDALRYCLAVDLPDTGPVLALSAGSLNGGDGLYLVTPDWAMTRDLTDNNVRGLFLDDAKLFGDTRDLLFGTDNRILRRSDLSLVNNLGILRPGEFVPQPGGPPVGVTLPDDFSFFTFSTYTLAMDPVELHRFAIEPRLAVEANVQPPVLAYGIVDQQTLVAFLDDGTLETLAEVIEPGSRWVAIAAPGPTHPLTGSFLVLESNRLLDRDRVLRIPRP
jgi:hypothetical protein